MARDPGEDRDVLLMSSSGSSDNRGSVLLFSGQEHKLRLGSSYLNALNPRYFRFLRFGSECLSRVPAGE